MLYFASCFWSHHSTSWTSLLSNESCHIVGKYVYVIKVHIHQQLSTFLGVCIPHEEPESQGYGPYLLTAWPLLRAVNDDHPSNESSLRWIVRYDRA